MKKLEFLIDDSFEGKTADALLKFIGCSAGLRKKIKYSGTLKINKIAAKNIDKISNGDFVEFEIPDIKNKPAPVELENVKIHFANEDLVVFNKPPFMPVHQSPGHYGDTLANFFYARYPDCSFHLANRLDMNTSGLCVVAKNKLAASQLCDSPPQKRYLAIVSGKIERAGVVDIGIMQENLYSLKRSASPLGKPAKTFYKPIYSTDRVTLLEITLHNGRTHQIRVHMSYIGHSLIGDELYGGCCDKIHRHALHCSELLLPETFGAKLIESTLPEDMRAALV